MYVRSSVRTILQWNTKVKSYMITLLLKGTSSRNATFRNKFSYFLSFDATLGQNHAKCILQLDMLNSRIKLIFKWLFFETSYMHAIHSDHTGSSVFYFSFHASLLQSLAFLQLWMLCLCAVWSTGLNKGYFYSIGVKLSIGGWLTHQKLHYWRQWLLP